MTTISRITKLPMPNTEAMVVPSRETPTSAEKRGHVPNSRTDPIRDNIENHFGPLINQIIFSGWRSPEVRDILRERFVNQLCATKDAKGGTLIQANIKELGEKFVTSYTLPQDHEIKQLQARFEGMIYNLAKIALGSKESAQDATQEIMVKLWRTSDRYDPIKAQAVTWVLMITRRHLVDCIRRLRTKENIKGTSSSHDVPTTEPDTFYGSSSDIRDEFRLVHSHLDALPPLQRTVLTGHYIHGLTLGQIAARLDEPIGTVKSALSRGLKRVREINQE